MTRNAAYYTHATTGQLCWDPTPPGSSGYVPWWALLRCDPGIIGFYGWLCKKHGIPLIKPRDGAHISVVKGEEPQHRQLWGCPRPTVALWYAAHVRYDNGRHAWLDVWSDDLNALRADLGLPPKINMSYHMTLGQLA